MRGEYPEGKAVMNFGDSGAIRRLWAKDARLLAMSGTRVVIVTDDPAGMHARINGQVAVYGQHWRSLVKVIRDGVDVKVTVSAGDVVILDCDTDEQTLRDLTAHGCAVHCRVTSLIDTSFLAGIRSVMSDDEYSKAVEPFGSYTCRIQR